MPAGQSRARTALVAAAFDAAAGRLGVGIRYPDGRLAGSRDPRAPVLVLHQPEALFGRLAAAGLTGFGESYQAGEWDSADLAGLLERMAAQGEGWQRLRPLIPRFARKRPAEPGREPDGNGHPGARLPDELPNELFALMLDKTMTYSSAMYAEDTDTLADAQRRKIQHILDLAEVREGTTLLEIGTGWGQLAIEAARRGALVHAITESPGQLTLASERIAAAGVAARVRLELAGYQEITPSPGDGYDAVVSVEMIETIGERYWPVFLGALEKHLAPGGRIVLQAITMRHEHLVATRGRSNWIQKYIRSDGQIPSVTAIEEACRAHTGLLVTDAGSLGPDYARTLALWRERFAASHDAVAALGFDETFQRTWNLYLAFRQASFAGGYLDAHHLVLERSGDPPADRESQPREPASRWADLGGPVHYADYGGPAGRPVLVCVHGLGGSGRRWAAIAPALALHYRVLTVDLGGFGRTKGNGLPATLPANQALLHQFLVQVVGEPAVLIGHSMGGTIAAMLASQHPELVSALILINPAVPWVRDEIDRRLAATRATLTQAFRTGRWEPDTAAPVPADTGAGPAGVEGATEPVLAARLIEQYRAAARGRTWTGRVDPDVLAAGRSLASVLLRRREFAGMLSGISVPVLWLHSEDDPAVPVGAARDCARLHPAWRFEVGQDMGHEPHWQAPDWTLSQVHPWLDETLGETRAARRT